MSKQGVTPLAVLSSTFILMMISSMTLMRYRLSPELGYHYGGAEFAVSPIDIILILAVFISLPLNLQINKLDGPIDFAILFYLIVMVLVSISSQSILYSAFEIVRLIKYFIFFMWVRAYITSGGSLFLAMSLMVLVQLFLSIFQLSSGQTIGGDGEAQDLNLLSGGVVRVVGSFGHPGVLAQFLNVTSVFFLVSALAKHNWKINLLMYALSSYVLLVTYSRTGLAVQALALLLCISIFVYAGRIKIGIRLFAIIFFALLAITALVSFRFDELYERFLYADDESGLIRIALAEIAYKMFQENPLFGVGLNSFTEVMSSYDETKLSNFWPHPVHNIYLLILSETGLIGFLAFIYLLFIALKSCILNLKSKTDKVYIEITFAFLGLFAIMLYGILGWSWRLDPIQTLFWMILAIISGISKSKFIGKGLK